MIGTANIELIQGNSATVRLTFEDLLPAGLVPLDLAKFDEIRLDVKKDALLESPVILALSIGDGLTITGDDENTLEIVFSRSFIGTDIRKLRYDILFVEGAVYATLIGGSINITGAVTL